MAPARWTCRTTPTGRRSPAMNDHIKGRPRAHGVAAVAACLFVLAGAAPAGASDPIGSGLFPDAVVDREGTAHVVWSIRALGDQSAARVAYCRIPRGAVACADTKLLHTCSTMSAQPRV